ncbi:MAG TPA: lipopolysaccharide kinase InaA family protein [Pseudomonadales bacterium]|nr:lipopolysaccharide kinase InaA family protein [Pseudomonadales bacterium]
MTPGDLSLAFGRGALRGRRDPDFGGPALSAFLKAPDALLEGDEVLKDDASARVVRRRMEGRDVVIKRYRYPDALRALRRAPRASRARRSCEGAALLGTFGILAPTPLAWVERRVGPLCTASWSISACVEGLEAPAALASAAADAPRRARLVDALAALVMRLQAARIVHGDLKATNLLVTAADEVVLLDLHAVRRVAANAPALQRDRARFLRNWEAQPALAAVFAARLARA